MSVLSGKNIVLGVTAGIAAYKSAFLVRLLVKEGANVKVVMTPSAKDFVTPLTLSTLSKNEVFSSFVDEEDENAQWNNHVELGLPVQIPGLLRRRDQLRMRPMRTPFFHSNDSR